MEASLSRHFPPPALAHVRCLLLLCLGPEVLRASAAAVSVDALAGFASLEEFESSGYPQLVSSGALDVICSAGRLERLTWGHSDDLGDHNSVGGLEALRHCPISHVDPSGPAHRNQLMTSSHIALLPATLRSSLQWYNVWWRFVVITCAHCGETREIF